MSLHSKPVVQATPPPNPLNRSLEVVIVTRTAIGRDGWPTSWRELRAKAAERTADGEPELAIKRMSMGELVDASYRQLDLAFFRDGGEDRPCLVAQAW